ncbi:MAG: SPFH domain-containing protein [Defluviitaleaceae bacterium]|nr:SPFH domain-containing protein [Defluviitaleaceae bacterium]MCL2262565.1 SPFH domain-containing protein [Defluviitaleaceae bacterium]
MFEGILISGIVGLIFLAILIMFLLWKRIPQNKAAVVTGLRKRIISGGGGLVVPLFERYDIISLENIKIPLDIDNAISSQGVPVTVKSVAVVKVKSDKESIYSAVEQFFRGATEKTSMEIATQSSYVLVGKLREIIAKMTVEEIYQDKDKFSSEVQENAAIALAEMGLEIKAFTVMSIEDINGYLQALGRKRISEVKRDAQIAEADAERETVVKTAEATRLGAEAKLRAETQVAEATKEKELKVQAYRREQESAKAIADNAYQIEENKVKKEVTETELQVELLRRQRETELAEQEAKRMEKELEATINKQADAERYRQERLAEAKKFQHEANAQAEATAIKLDGQARAEAIRLQGQAEAEAIQAKGLAEAEAMMKKAEAFKQYNDAAVIQMLIERLPEIAKNVAAPLSQTEKIVVVDNGGGAGGGKSGAAKVAGYVTDIIAQLPETVEALTGVDLIDVLKTATAGNPEIAKVVEAVAKKE